MVTRFEPERNGRESVFAAALAGVIGEEDVCCQVTLARGEECCMATRTRYVLKMIESAGGPSLAQMEAIASGEAIVARAAVVGDDPDKDILLCVPLAFSPAGA